MFDRGADSHIYCFQGFGIVQTQFNPNPRDCGGPENSLNLWGEGNPNAVLADYGNAYSLMLYLFDRYGTDIISRLHRDGDLQGLPSLEAALKAEGASSLYGVIHDFQSMTLLDKLVGDAKHSVVLGTSKRRVTSKSLRSSVNLANPSANRRRGPRRTGRTTSPCRTPRARCSRDAICGRWCSAAPSSCRRFRWRGRWSMTTPTARATPCCSRATPTTPTPRRSPR